MYFVFRAASVARRRNRARSRGVFERARDDDGAPFPWLLHRGDRHVEGHRFPDARQVPGEDVGGAERPGLAAARVVGREGGSLARRANVEAVGELLFQRLFKDLDGGAQRVVGSRGGDFRGKECECLARRESGPGKG
jgi:hypothetical protein